MSFFLFIFARMNKKRIIKWAKIVAIIYISGGVALYFLQDAILFHPVTLNRTYSYNFPEPHKDINIPIDSKDTLNLVDFASTDTIARGKLTEQKLYDWALQVYKIARKRFPADSIIIYGKSMGTGIAAQLVSTRDCKRLILETPYYDFPAVVSHYLPIYPAKWMLHYQIPTYQYLQHVTAPITIFHGTKDRVVTYKNSKRLLPFLKSTDELISIEGGSHNNLYRYKETVNKLDSVLRL